MKFRKNGKIGPAFCTALILMLLMSGIQVGNRHASAADVSITLRCGIQSLGSTNPLIADSDSWRILNLIYEGAIKKDTVTGELVPYIAVGTANQSLKDHSVGWNDCQVGNFGYCPREDWEDPAKPEMILFYDFGDVYWHDGIRMSIRDVMFSFHAQAGSQIEWLGHPLADKGGLPGSNYTETKWLFIQNVWESEDHSRAALKFVLQKPLYSVFESYASSYILPYHIWGGSASNQSMNNTLIWCDPGFKSTDKYSWKDYFAVKFPNTWPIGSGPFAWAGSTSSRITLVPWKDHFYRPGYRYYSYDSGVAPQPRIDYLALKLYNSENQALADLESDRLDYIAWNVDASVVNRFAEDINIRHRVLKSDASVFLESNMRRGSFGYFREYENGVGTSVDAGKPLRVALAHCIDPAAVNAIYNPLVSPEPLLTPLYGWGNSSAPSYSYDPAEAMKILENAGYLLANPTLPPGNGNWWLNPDGTQIGSLPDGRIEILIVASEYDNLRFQVGTLIATQMRAVGINAELVPLEPAALAERLSLRDFDLAIDWQSFPAMFRSRPEIYYSGEFHSDNALNGPNDCGYSNSSFDSKVSMAMGTPDLESERLYVRDLVASVSYDVPISTLYYESNIEIYRTSNFEGFVDDGSGSLLNARSMASVSYMGKTVLRSKFINVPMTALSNSTFKLSLKVTDQNDRAIMGAKIELESSSGFIWNTAGSTDAQGMFSTNFTAPYVPMTESHNNWEALTIYIKSASLEGYSAALEARAVITVFPDRLRSLFVWATAVQDVISDRDSAGAPGFTYVEVLVTDQSNIPVDGAVVQVNTSGTGLLIGTATIRTDAGGKVSIKFTAPDVEEPRVCHITFSAVRTGFINASTGLNLTVAPYTAGPEQIQPPEQNVAVPAAAVIISIIAIAAVYIIRKRKNGN